MAARRRLVTEDDPSPARPPPRDRPRPPRNLCRRACGICGAVALPFAMHELATLSPVLRAMTAENPRGALQHPVRDLVNARCSAAQQNQFVVDAVLPWAAELRAAQPAIHHELLAWEEAEGSYEPAFATLDEQQRSLTSNECWRSLWLRAYGLETRVAAAFPTTMRLLDGSRASSVMFSILAPGCAIDEHRGENKAVLRYHLGVEIPPPTAGRLALYVGGGSPVEVSWEDGADLLFDDTFVHRVENRAAARRVVLFVDVPRHDCPLAVRALLRRVHEAVRASADVQRLVANANLVVKYGSFLASRAGNRTKGSEDQLVGLLSLFDGRTSAGV